MAVGRAADMCTSNPNPNLINSKSLGYFENGTRTRLLGPGAGIELIMAVGFFLSSGVLFNRKRLPMGDSDRYTAQFERSPEYFVASCSCSLLSVNQSYTVTPLTSVMPTRKRRRKVLEPLSII